MTVPFTYLVKHIPSNTVYYGCRFAKGCSPEDLWTTYFTSSIHVKALLAQDGKNSFLFEVRKVFTDIGECRNWESRVLKRMRVVQRNDFINKSNNKAIDPDIAKLSNYRRSDKAKAKQIEIGRSTGKSNLGRIRSDQFKLNAKKIYTKRLAEGSIKQFTKGRKESDATKLKKRLSKLGKPSNAIGNYQPVCSCICCHKELTSSTIKQHYNFHHLGIKSTKSVNYHSEETKALFRLRRNKTINNSITELRIDDFDERSTFLHNHPEYTPGKLTTKKARNPK